MAGVLGAYTLLYPKARIAFVQPILVFPLILRLPAWLFTALWFALQVYGGWSELDAAPGAGGIAWWAHVGGFVAGLFMAWWLARPPPAPPPPVRGQRRPWG